MASRDGPAEPGRRQQQYYSPGWPNRSFIWQSTIWGNLLWKLLNISGSNHKIAKHRRQNLDLICSLAHAKPQLPENFLSKDWVGSRSLMARSKFWKFWPNFALAGLLVYFVGPAGGDPTWRLETPPTGPTNLG